MTTLINDTDLTKCFNPTRFGMSEEGIVATDLAFETITGVDALSTKIDSQDLLGKFSFFYYTTLTINYDRCAFTCTPNIVPLNRTYILFLGRG